MSGVWAPRGVPPQSGTRQQLSPSAKAAAAGFAHLEEVQRHLLRAIREPASFVAVAPIGTGKFTAALLGLASRDGGHWLVPEAALDHATRALAELDGRASVGPHDGPIPDGAPVLVASDVHLAPDARGLIERLAATGRPVVATAEPTPGARGWAESIAARSTRCGFVDATPYGTARWRLVAPWRDRDEPPDNDAHWQDYARTATGAQASSWFVRGRDAGLALATELLSVSELSEPDAAVRPAGDDWWRVDVVQRGLGPEPERADEVVFVDVCLDATLLAREGTASGPREGRPALALSCRDAADVLLGACLLQRLRSGSLCDASELFADAAGWVRQAAEATPERALYAAVAGLSINRGNAGSWLGWTRRVGAESALATLRARTIEPGVAGR